MALIITDECIDCNACEIECPNNAIYAASVTWDYAGKEHKALNDDHTYIATEKCSECVGFYDEPQCVPACPSEAIIPDPAHQYSTDELLIKKQRLDLIGR